MQLPVADVDRDDARRAGLEQRVREAASGRADVRAVAPRRIDPNASSAFASFSPPRETNGGGRSTVELDVLVHLLARLLVAGNEPGEHERLRLARALREPALDEERVEPLLHGVSRTADTGMNRSMPTWLLILIICS